MAKYINLNASSLPPLDTETSGILSRVMSAGSNMSSNTLILICGVILFAVIGFICYYYYVTPSLNPTYNPNS